ncbi:MAG: HAD family phosphatase [Chitinophagaceae bacterium]|nr:HAD family phosphatase [Chitinophagaceae bacterium]
MQNIKNIIFDLGGVILNIDFKKTYEAFHLIGLKDFWQYINQFHISDLFLKYEIGQIDDLEFIDNVAKLSDAPMSKDKIVQAWNALLLDFPKERIELLKKIKSKYRTFLLSNTNSLHLQEYNERLHNEQGVYLEDLFEKTYYSHVIKMRKPHAEIFELVLNENNLKPSETLFIDDTYSNFEEAQRLGIQIHHLEPGTTIAGMEIFKPYA